MASASGVSWGHVWGEMWDGEWVGMELGVVCDERISGVWYSGFSGVGWGVVCYCTVLNSFAEHRTQYSTGVKVQYSTVQYSTVQYSTVQCSTVQYSIIQPLLDHGRIEI
jgi:hypothetical protein